MPYVKIFPYPPFIYTLRQLMISVLAPCRMIQADFHIHFPCSRIHVHEMDSRDISLAGKALSGFDLLVCEMFVWSDSIKYARSMNSGVKVIYCVHSILQQEWIANAQNKWVGFEHFHRLQRELVAVADFGL